MSLPQSHNKNIIYIFIIKINISNKYFITIVK